MSWSDVFPAFVRDKRNAALVLYRRTDATLGDFYFTGGAPALTRYPVGDGFALGAAQDLGELPGTILGDGANRPVGAVARAGRPDAVQVDTRSG